MSSEQFGQQHTTVVGEVHGGLLGSAMVDARAQHFPLHSALHVGRSLAGHHCCAGLVHCFERQPVQQFLRQALVIAHAIIVATENPRNSFT